MANKIQLKRGLKSKLSTLSAGEPAFLTDTRELYVGTGSGNVNMGGSLWYTGTAMSGTSTMTTYYYSACPQVKAGDVYLNTSNGCIYQCTTAGSGSNAKWTYKGSIKGANGSNATVTVDASLNKNSFNPVKNSVITKYLAGQPIPLTVTGYEYEKMFTNAFMTDPGDAQYYFLDGASLADCPSEMVNQIGDGDIGTRWDVVKSTDGRVPQTGRPGSAYNLYPTKSYLLRFRNDGEDDGYVYGSAFVVAEFDGTGYDNFWEALILNKLR